MGERKSASKSSKASGVRRKAKLIEVNERLVLAALEAHEAIDSARDSQRDAEAEVTTLRATEEDLRIVAQFRERLIGVIGHDLRNPLNTVLVASDLLVAGGNKPLSDRELATRILASARRMRSILDQILDFTRARLGGGFPLTLGRVDIGAVCQQIATELRLGKSARVDIAVEGDVVGNWDASLLGQAISNVAGNAIEHGVGAAVRIDVRDADTSIVIDIINSGPTISPDQIETLFDPFRRGTTTAPARGHLGLGLYIAHEVVASHNGTLTARSSNGTTTFTMRLPRNAARATDSRRSNSDPR